MRRDLAATGKWLAAAAVTGIILYLVTAAAAGGRRPIWPYILLGAVTLLGLGLYLMNRGAAKSEGATGAASTGELMPQLNSSYHHSTDAHAVTAAQEPFKLTVGNDGHFVGGDDAVSVDLVVYLLDMPAAEREVRVTAEALQDVTYKRSQPDDYARLRDAIRLYQNSINKLMCGEIYYYWKWQLTDLAEAVLELRRLALPASIPSEEWFTWPAEQPDSVLDVWLRLDDADSTRDVYYLKETPGGSWEETTDPPDEPIWLKEVSPGIVWTRIAPAVVIRAARDSPEAPVAVNLDSWVLSDRRPSELAKTTPCRETGGSSLESWTW